MIRNVPAAEWVAISPSMSGYSYRHLWSYCVASAKRWRAKPEMVGVFGGGNCLALASVRMAELPMGMGGVAYVSGGPILHPDASVDDLHFVLEDLVTTYVNKRGMVLRIAPPLEWVLNGIPVGPVLQSNGFTLTDPPKPYRTLVIDLDREEADIRAGFHQKWRNHLNRSERSGVEVRHTTNAEGLAEFARLHDELMVRKGFDVELTTDFYLNVATQTAGEERFDVLLAYDGDDLVAGHVGSSLGQTTVYLLGASRPRGNELRASHALQWEAIVRARANGSRWYDLGGIDPANNPGVYHFKSQMRGVEHTVPGPFECAPSGGRMHVVRWAERGYRAIRRRGSS